MTIDGKEFVCQRCDEMFPIWVWHCPVCDHHWPAGRTECWNCHAYDRMSGFISKMPHLGLERQYAGKQDSWRSWERHGGDV